MVFRALMRKSPDHFAQQLVETLKSDGDLHDPRLERAFLETPRHIFLPDVPLETAYANEAIPIKRDGAGNVISAVSQPAIMAHMLEQLRLERGHNVLEIGAASGYNAALILHMVGDTGRMTTVEIDPDLVEIAKDRLQRARIGGDVTVVQVDGAQGYAPRASYDRIIATVGVWDVPSAWQRQLKPNGILVTPIWLESMQVSAAFHPHIDGTLYSDDNRPCWFVRLRGADAGPSVTTRVGNTSLELLSTNARKIDGAALLWLMNDWAENNTLDMPMKYGRLFGGFLPYLSIHTPPEGVLTYFSISDDTKPYGLTASGFALIMRGSACFVPFSERGTSHCFGSSDSFILLQEALTAWRHAGEPGIEKLRLRLIPKDTRTIATPSGKLFTRHHHYLQAWFDG